MVTLDESAEQRQFRSSLHSWGERYFDDAAAPASDPAGDIRKLWPELAELGVLALASDPDSGGAAEVVIAAEELGRVACPGPVVASIVAAGALTGETRDLIREGQVIPSLVINSIVPFSGLASVFLKIEDSEIWEVAREATWEPFVTSAGLEWSRGDVRKVRSLGPAAGAQVLRDLGTAAYLVGAAERQLEIAAAYANERKQFGHPIGEFQAVSHPLAAAYVDLLAAKSLTVIAASTFDAGKDARRGALEARIAAANAGLRGAYAAHQAMGGIGFAVEGPLARRSLQLREVALSAPLGAAETELLEGSGSQPRKPGTESGYSASEEAFRREVRDFIGSLGEAGGFFIEADLSEWLRCKEIFAALAAKNWLALSWPREYGGEARSPVYEAILWDELAYARVARPPFSAGIVAKAIMAAGSEAQKRQYLEPIRRGELHFALGYSEPEAGSDLTGLRTRAVRDGDTYVVTGEKRWTSLGHVADKLWLLCRTGTLESRARGLSILIVDMDSPGISIRPIYLMDGGRVNEIHLSEVVVPIGNRIGDENSGWSIISQSLAVERHVQFAPNRLVRDMEDLREWAAEHGLLDDLRFVGKLRELEVKVAGARALSLRMIAAVGGGRDTTVLAAANKLYFTELCQEIARVPVEFNVPEALISGTMVEFLWRQSILETLGGGTSEIMRGIVARRGLRIG
jgi:alkylation response protein AidB-like acyl-CoA dehydrogenase